MNLMRCGDYRLWFTFMGLAACLAVPACNGRNPGFGCGVHGDGGFKNGVTYVYSIAWVTCGRQPCFILVADGLGGGGASTNDQGCTGHLLAGDGRKIAWSCATKDGKAGTVQIADQQFDLSKGPVFLLMAKQNQTKVEQFAMDLSKLPTGESEELVAAIREVDPRVVGFLKVAQGEQ